ncbi:hypothetical protein F0562_000354 [Nyssa sinensis]|uniref:Uncharacterized protein n=1 Tax=Nyssa sinensis TaxID=561372 RepID=A0A5J5C3H5_9ASTE|nr:hypothetical protein F0562_000354 [Nyssa sinensis]
MEMETQDDFLKRRYNSVGLEIKLCIRNICCFSDLLLWRPLKQRVGFDILLLTSGSIEQVQGLRDTALQSPL